MKNQLKTLLVLACIVALGSCNKDCPEPANGPSPTTQFQNVDASEKGIVKED